MRSSRPSRLVSGPGSALSICHGIVKQLGGADHRGEHPGRGLHVPGQPAGTPRSPPSPRGRSARERPPAPALLRVSCVERRRARRPLDVPRAEGARRHRGGRRPRGARASARTTTTTSILCDLLMPELTGMDVYDEVCRLRPGYEHRIVFIDGRRARVARARASSPPCRTGRCDSRSLPAELRRLVAEHAARARRWGRYSSRACAGTGAARIAAARRRPAKTAERSTRRAGSPGTAGRRTGCGCPSEARLGLLDVRREARRRS